MPQNTENGLLWRNGGSFYREKTKGSKCPGDLQEQSKGLNELATVAW